MGRGFESHTAHFFTGSLSFCVVNVAQTPQFIKEPFFNLTFVSLPKMKAEGNVTTMYSRCEILFPHSRVSGLKKLKGEDWRKLAERIALLPETDKDALSFSHMMIKLCDCLNCDLGSYKAALGCSACSQRTINALRDTDLQLLRRFEKSRRDVRVYLEQVDFTEEKAA